jgi:outer membrane protein TolC
VRRGVQKSSEVGWGAVALAGAGAAEQGCRAGEGARAPVNSSRVARLAEGARGPVVQGKVPWDRGPVPRALAACAFVAVAGLSLRVATAAETPPAPPVEALVAEALERAPALAAARARAAAAREMAAPAGALPNPMVELMLADVAFPSWTVGEDEMSMLAPEVRQAIPYPGKRRAARDVTHAEGDARDADLAAAQRALAAEVRIAYARLYALDRERQALAAAAELLDVLAATAAARYAVGDAEQGAVLRVQLEEQRVSERREDVTAERAAVVAALNRLRDRAGAEPLGVVAALPGVTVPPTPWEEAAVAASAEVARARAEATAAERRAAAVRLESKPDFLTGAAVGYRGSFDPIVTLRFGLELPLWRDERVRPMVRAAEMELETARAAVREAEAAARAAAAVLAAEWTRAERQVVRYREAIVPQTSAVVDAARSAYLAGRGDFPAVIEAFREWLDARAALAGREAERFRAWAAAQALLGEPGEDGVRAAARENPRAWAPATARLPGPQEPGPARGSDPRGGPPATEAAQLAEIARTGGGA